MAEPFIGEVRMWAIRFAPYGWAECDGQTMAASENPALYAIIGNTWGGTYGKNFVIPDFRGRTPVYPSNGLPYGVGWGFEYIQLTTDELPTHDHVLNATLEDADAAAPTGAMTAKITDITVQRYGDYVDDQQILDNQTVASSGGGGAHPNMQPYLVVRFCIALLGIFPSRN